MLVLIDPRAQVAGDTGVQSAVALACKNIDPTPHVHSGDAIATDIKPEFGSSLSGSSSFMESASLARAFGSRSPGMTE